MNKYGIVIKEREITLRYLTKEELYGIYKVFKLDSPDKFTTWIEYEEEN